MRIEPPFQRRFPKSTPAVIAMAVAVFAVTAIVTGVRASDDDDDVDAPPEVHSEPQPSVYLWTNDEDAARHNFETLLHRRIAFVDRVCTLSDTQKQRLEFVSRGDVKRFLDRIHEINNQIQFAEITPAEATDLLEESQEIKSRVSTVGSLLANSLGKLLTPEQRARYEPLRTVIHAGGRIQTEEPESDEILEIDLHETAFADDDAVHFGEFPCLVRLFLANTQITDDGLAHMQGLTNLEWLDLAGTHVTGAGLEHLQSMKNLQWLSLAGTRVTDSGLVPLARLARLQSLNLEGTQVTDAGLSHLAGLTRLERLNLKETEVSDAGVARLQRALPNLSIQVRDRRRRGNQWQGAMCGGCIF